VAQEKRQPKSMRRILGNNDVRRHVLVIGDPSRTQVLAFLREFFHADHAPLCDRPVVFLLNRPSPDVRELLEETQAPWSARTYLLDGSPARDADLYRAAAEKAAAIIVLPRRGRAGGRGEDRSNLLRVLRIKRYLGQIVPHAEDEARPRSCLASFLACMSSICGRRPGEASHGSQEPNPTPRFLVAVQASESRKFAVACGLHEVVARDSLDYSLLGHTTVTPAVSTLVSNLVRSSESALASRDQAWAVEFKTGAECEVYTVGMGAELNGMTVGRVALALARRTDGAVHVLGCTLRDAKYPGRQQILEQAVADATGRQEDEDGTAARAAGLESLAQATRAANVAALSSLAGMQHSRLLLGLPSVVIATGCRLVVLTDSLETARASLLSVTEALAHEAAHCRARRRLAAKRRAAQRPQGPIGIRRAMSESAAKDPSVRIATMQRAPGPGDPHGAAGKAAGESAGREGGPGPGGQDDSSDDGDDGLGGPAAVGDATMVEGGVVSASGPGDDEDDDSDTAEASEAMARFVSSVTTDPEDERDLLSRAKRRVAERSRRSLPVPPAAVVVAEALEEAGGSPVSPGAVEAAAMGRDEAAEEEERNVKAQTEAIRNAKARAGRSATETRQAEGKSGTGTVAEDGADGRATDADAAAADAGAGAAAAAAEDGKAAAAAPASAAASTPSAQGGTKPRRAPLSPAVAPLTTTGTQVGPASRVADGPAPPVRRPHSPGTLRRDRMTRELVADLTRYSLTPDPATREANLEPPAVLLGAGGHVVVLCPSSVDWFQLVHVLRPLRRSRLPGVVVLHPRRPSRRDWARLQVRAAAKDPRVASKSRRRVMGWSDRPNHMRQPPSARSPTASSGAAVAVSPSQRFLGRAATVPASRPASAAAASAAPISHAKTAPRDAAAPAGRSPDDDAKPHGSGTSSVAMTLGSMVMSAAGSRRQDVPLYLVVGSPEDSLDLGRAGVQTARRVLVLSGRSEASPSGDARPSGTRRSSSDQDIVHDALTVFTAQSIRSSLHQAAPPIVMELRQPLHLELVVAMTASVNAVAHAATMASKRRQHGRAVPVLPAAVSIGARLPPRGVTLARMSPLVRAIATGEAPPEAESVGGRDHGDDEAGSDSDDGAPGDDEDDVYALPDMADGSVYASTMLEGLMAKSFFDSNVMPIITQLVSGGGACFTLTAVPDDPKIVRDHIAHLHDPGSDDEPGWLSAPATPAMALPRDALTYGEMYEYLLSFGLMPTAILRHGREAMRGSQSGAWCKAHTPAHHDADAAHPGVSFATGLDLLRTERAAAATAATSVPSRPYVYSAPPLECLVGADDAIFVLSLARLNCSPINAALVSIQRAVKSSLVWVRARRRFRKRKARESRSSLRRAGSRPQK